MKKRTKPLQRRTPLARSRQPIPRIKPARAKEKREYRIRAVRFLAEHPVCGVWLKENGWQQIGIADSYVRKKCGAVEFTTAQFLFSQGAPMATQIHHMAKRRGAMLNAESFWLQVSREAHERIERNLGWAREQGFSLNF